MKLIAQPTGMMRRETCRKTAEAIEEVEESDDDMGFGLFDGDDDPGPERKITAVVNDQGTGSATFSIPGLSTIPTNVDGISQTHKVTIAEFSLTAELEWVVIPADLTDVFLTVRPYFITHPQV
jgi:hypothetical protein